MLLLHSRNSSRAPRARSCQTPGDRRSTALTHKAVSVPLSRYAALQRSCRPAARYRRSRDPGRLSPCRCSRIDELVGAIRHLSAGGLALHRQADRAGDELRRAGSDRHREHPPAQRAAPAHRRSERILTAADRHRRRAEGYQPLGVRSTDRARYAHESAARLCDAEMGSIISVRTAKPIYLRQPMVFRPNIKECMQKRSARPGRGSVFGAPSAQCRTGPRSRCQGRCRIHLAGIDRRQAVSAQCSAFHCCARAAHSASSPLLRTTVAALHRPANRASDHLRRPGGDRHRERPAVRRNPGQEPPARRGQRAQVAVPRQHEPRAAHAAQRHPRLHRADSGQRLWRAAGEDGVRARAHLSATASICSA